MPAILTGGGGSTSGAIDDTTTGTVLDEGVTWSAAKIASEIYIASQTLDLTNVSFINGLDGGGGDIIIAGGSGNSVAASGSTVTITGPINDAATTVDNCWSASKTADAIAAETTARGVDVTALDGRVTAIENAPGGPATSMGTTGAPVVVNAGPPPTAGQHLQATSATNAAWTTMTTPTLSQVFDASTGGAFKSIAMGSNSLTFSGNAFTTTRFDGSGFIVASVSAKGAPSLKMGAPATAPIALRVTDSVDYCGEITMGPDSTNVDAITGPGYVRIRGGTAAAGKTITAGPTAITMDGPLQVTTSNTEAADITLAASDANTNKIALTAGATSGIEIRTGNVNSFVGSTELDLTSSAATLNAPTTATVQAGGKSVVVDAAAIAVSSPLSLGGVSLTSAQLAEILRVKDYIRVHIVSTITLTASAMQMPWTDTDAVTRGDGVSFVTGGRILLAAGRYYAFTVEHSIIANDCNTNTTFYYWAVLENLAGTTTDTYQYGRAYLTNSAQNPLRMTTSGSVYIPPGSAFTYLTTYHQHAGNAGSTSTHSVTSTAGRLEFSVWEI